MQRESKEQYFLKIARLVATRATCPRRAVGCVVTNEYGHILATGYNGVPRGYDHCNEQNPCGGQNASSGESLNCCMATHAEQNALLQCSNTMLIHTIYITTSPCDTCCKLIANTSCKKVVFHDLYPHSTGLDMLKYLGIEVVHERIVD
jgi:dCMP deaminase